MSEAPAAGRSTDRARGIVNALSFDVEDYFHAHALSGAIQPAEWDAQPQRLEGAMQAALGLLAEHDVRATFFILGWVADRHPGLVRDLVAAGHEVASHGFRHVRVGRQTPDEFRRDVTETKALLEDIGGVEVRGYRAANFSIEPGLDWAYDILAETGHRYSSSLYPIRHDHYGRPDAPRFCHRPREADAFIEIPIGTVRWGGRNFPCGGGGYFRLAPYALSRWALRRVNRDEGRPCVFYLHPWELDPEQPRVEKLPLKSRLRHYVNLSRTAGRLRCLLTEFAWDRIDRVFLAEPAEAITGESWAVSR